MATIQRIVVTRCAALCTLAVSACTARAPAPQAAALPSASAEIKRDSWVVGTVFKADNGRAFPSVTLKLYFQEVERTPRAPVRGRTNNDGKFEFGPLTAGTYCVLASSLGYESAAREFTLRQGKRDTVTIVLGRRGGRISLERCLPDAASIRMCPLDADSIRRKTQHTSCPGQI